MCVYIYILFIWIPSCSTMVGFYNRFIWLKFNPKHFLNNLTYFRQFFKNNSTGKSLIMKSSPGYQMKTQLIQCFASVTFHLQLELENQVHNVLKLIVSFCKYYVNPYTNLSCSAHELYWHYYHLCISFNRCLFIHILVKAHLIIALNFCVNHIEPPVNFLPSMHV